MIEVVTGLLPILLVDALNPVLFGFMVIASMGVKEISYLLGYTGGSGKH